MVTNIGGVIAHLVHDFVGRMNFPGLQRLHFGHIVTQRAALQQVTVVKKQGVGNFGPGGFDQRAGTRQAVLVRRLVLVIVVAQQVHVHISGLQNAQTHFGSAHCAGHTSPHHCTDEGTQVQTHPRLGNCHWVLLGPPDTQRLTLLPNPQA